MNLSIHRIWYLFKMQWVENRKMYTFGLLAMLGILAMFFFGGSESENSQAAFFMIGIFLSSSVFTSTILSRFSEKTKGMHALMLPASASEKIIVAVIYSVIIFPLVYLALVYPLMVAAHYYHSEIKGEIAPLWNMHAEVGFDLYVKAYFILQSFVLFCSIMFRRFTFVKTAVLVSVILLEVFLLNEKLHVDMYQHHLQPTVLPKGFIPDPPSYGTETETKVIYPPKGSKQPPKTITSAPKKVLLPTHNFSTPYGGPFMPAQFSRTRVGLENLRVWEVVLPAWQQCLFTMLFYLVIPFFWLLAWLRLKEKTLV